MRENRTSGFVREPADNRWLYSTFYWADRTHFFGSSARGQKLRKGSGKKFDILRHPPDRSRTRKNRNHRVVKRKTSKKKYWSALRAMKEWIVFKWLNRRSQRQSYTWARFGKLWGSQWGIPRPRICEKQQEMAMGQLGLV